LEKVGLAKIVRLAYQMNQSGKRKYQQNEIQKELL